MSGGSIVSIFDKQRITSVRALEALGYSFPPTPADAPAVSLVREADQMHALLVQRANRLDGCAENSPEERERAAITDAIKAYERKRWTRCQAARANSAAGRPLPATPQCLSGFVGLVRQGLPEFTALVVGGSS